MLLKYIFSWIFLSSVFVRLQHCASVKYPDKANPIIIPTSPVKQAPESIGIHDLMDNREEPEQKPSRVVPRNFYDPLSESIGIYDLINKKNQPEQAGIPNGRGFSSHRNSRRGSDDAVKQRSLSIGNFDDDENTFFNPSPAQIKSTFNGDSESGSVEAKNPVIMRTEKVAAPIELDVSDDEGAIFDVEDGLEIKATPSSPTTKKSSVQKTTTRSTLKPTKRVERRSMALISGAHSVETRKSPRRRPVERKRVVVNNREPAQRTDRRTMALFG